ncbi:unnamed protein product [Heterosigma akashiwo]
MADVAVVASKTYCRGLVLITVWHEGAFYVVVQPGEGDQPLLDVRFPDVSRHGQGLHVHTYTPTWPTSTGAAGAGRPWAKLTLWHAPSLGMPALVPQIRDKQLLDLSSDAYLQSYVVMAAPPGAAQPATQRQALFRFGSWCYSGEVTLTPTITLKDIPHVIPALRLQQNRLSYMCDVTKNAHVRFAPPWPACSSTRRWWSGRWWSRKVCCRSSSRRWKPWGWGQVFPTGLRVTQRTRFLNLQWRPAEDAWRSRGWTWWPPSATSRRGSSSSPSTSRARSTWC